MKLKKLARYARLGKLKDNSLAAEFRKLMKLKKLARHARLGKLKDDSLEYASEGCRLLTFNS